VHNRHETRGGADEVVDQERDLLVDAGHVVDQYLLEPASADRRGAVNMAVSAVWNRTVVAELEARVADFDPDVIHVHTPFPLMSPAALRVGHRTGRPTVTTAHSFRYACIAGTCLRDGLRCESCVGSGLKLAGVRHACYHDSRAASAALTVSLVGHRAMGTFSRSVDRFITLTAFARDLLVRDGFPAERITVKPNSVPDPGSPVPPSLRAPYALFAGRLVAEKGIQTLLTAWQHRPGGLDLYLAGDGPLRSMVDAEAARNPAIRVLGWCEAQRLAQLQAEATLTVVPSEWYEAGPPLVLLQALACGTPVVCSDLENICSPVVVGQAGFAFRTGDARALADAVQAVVGSPDEPPGEARAWLGDHARRRYLDEFTPAASLHSLERIYAEVTHAVATTRS